jgi:hypothetical protein
MIPSISFRIGVRKGRPAENFDDLGQVAKQKKEKAADIEGDDLMQLPKIRTKNEPSAPEDFKLLGDGLDDLDTAEEEEISEEEYSNEGSLNEGCDWRAPPSPDRHRRHSHGAHNGSTSRRRYSENGRVGEVGHHRRRRRTSIVLEQPAPGDEGPVEVVRTRRRHKSRPEVEPEEKVVGSGREIPEVLIQPDEIVKFVVVKEGRKGPQRMGLDYRLMNGDSVVLYAYKNPEAKHEWFLTLRQRHRDRAEPEHLLTVEREKKRMRVIDPAMTKPLDDRLPEVFAMSFIDSSSRGAKKPFRIAFPSRGVNYPICREKELWYLVSNEGLSYVKDGRLKTSETGPLVVDGNSVIPEGYESDRKQYVIYDDAHSPSFVFYTIASGSYGIMCKSPFCPAFAFALAITVISE